MIRPRSFLWMSIVAFSLIGSATLPRLQAQELPPSFASMRYAPALDTARQRTSMELSDTTSIPKTYWLEGALVGGTVLGLLGGALAGGLCADPDSGGTGPCWDNVLLGIVIGFGTGGSFGALVGGQLKKPSQPGNRVDQQMEPAQQESTDSSQ
jgi:hypothetical protein